MQEEGSILEFEVFKTQSMSEDLRRRGGFGSFQLPVSSSSHDVTGTFWGEDLSRRRRAKNLGPVPGLEMTDSEQRDNMEVSAEILGLLSSFYPKGR